MAHEQSETTYLNGLWQNIFGRNTPQAGQVLPKRYEFEEEAGYPDEINANIAAKLRSIFQGRERDFLGLSSMKRFMK